VLQTTTVFRNVSRGVLAKGSDMKKAFGTADLDEVCLIMLAKGALQVSQKERKDELKKKYNEIATIVADKCINSDTKKPFPVSMIESSMKEMHFSVHPSRSAKQQALDVIRDLQQKETLKIERAMMRLRLTVPRKLGKHAKHRLEKASLIAEFEDDDWGVRYEMTVLITPGSYGKIEAELNDLTHGDMSCDIIDLKVQTLGESKV
jgi:ribosome maturation protein SDO1